MSNREPASWDAATYHRISNPHVSWGQPILDRLQLTGDESLIDAGCGTGRLTTQVLERLPRGRVIAVDRDANMLAQARATLEPLAGGRVRFVQADLVDLDTAVSEPVDRVFSTATFHWIPDHAALFTAIYRTLNPGGMLVAQCGGEGNIARFLAIVGEVGHQQPFAAYLGDWSGPWTFSDEATTRAELAIAGFEEIDVAIIDAPVIQPDAASFAEFVRSIVLGEHVARLPDDETRDDYIARITERAGNDVPPYTLDYRRLNISARRPA